jgi:hypothetical protein
VASSPSLRTQFRRALQKALHAHFLAEGFPKLAFEGGVIEGPQADRDIACVWWEGKRPQARDGNNEEAFFQVRVLRQFKQDQGGQTPREDVADELERTAEVLEDGLLAVITVPLLETASGLTLTGWADYFTVTEVAVNYPGQYVQATLTAWARNRTATGG